MFCRWQIFFSALCWLQIHMLGKTLSDQLVYDEKRKLKIEYKIIYNWPETFIPKNFFLLNCYNFYNENEQLLNIEHTCTGIYF